MYAFLIIIFVVIAVLLVVSILLQSSKGTGLAGTFGGAGGVNTVFGGRGAATLLSKITTYLAVFFFLLTIAINFVIRSDTQRRGSVVKEQSMERVITPSSSLPKPKDIDVDEVFKPSQPVEKNEKKKKK
ncbi:MAG: preprotein translocase subunit SecG [Candidatus Marinimicrobia bacterium]|jgi:preprotein translocase subunit SecG|nr:preprotein translocase subunit SecG [Candidatus Neomarinimicrobiota bacterium]